MRFLVINTDYQDFLADFYERNPRLAHSSFEEQTTARAKSLFGVADFYSNALNTLGHESTDLIANNQHAQLAWAIEHLGLKRREPTFRMRKGVIPWVSWREAEVGESLLAAQIQYYNPDVLINQAVDGVPSSLLRKPLGKHALLVGQHASPLPPNCDLSSYDLIISSLPNLVDDFRRLGLRSELHPLGFDPRVLDQIGEVETDIPASFVGSLSKHHSQRAALLEHLAEACDVQIWGIGSAEFSQSSPIASHHRGRAWGKNMYDILKRSGITINCHIDMAGDFANNLRLYEATGVGTLLITDNKANLSQIFDVGEEIVAYRNTEECVKLINYFLNNEAERNDIARAGQQRTLNEHTYVHRMRELLEILERYA